jgi:hypothetical protein
MSHIVWPCSEFPFASQSHHHRITHTHFPLSWLPSCGSHPCPGSRIWVRFACGQRSWGTLLGACSTYESAKLGEDAAKEMLKLEPKDASVCAPLQHLCRSWELGELGELCALWCSSQGSQEPCQIVSKNSPPNCLLLKKRVHLAGREYKYIHLVANYVPPFPCCTFHSLITRNYLYLDWST